MLTRDASEIAQITASLTAFAAVIQDRDPWLAQTLQNRAAWWNERALPQAT